MARACENCGRGYQKGHTRSHSNIATNVRRMVNLQVRHVDGKRERVCTSCIRTSKQTAKKKATA